MSPGNFLVVEECHYMILLVCSHQIIALDSFQINAMVMKFCTHPMQFVKVVSQYDRLNIQALMT
jgi:hypothetical protein